MSLHPAPPVGLDELVDGYEQTVRAVLDMGATLRADEAGRPTDCPGWTVADQIAHVASGEAMVAGEPVPDVDVSGRGYVRHLFGALIERYVESRRTRSLEDVVAELEALLAQRLAFYRSASTTGATPAVGPFGPTTVEELVSIRLFDIWTHEQDLREALARPGGLDSPGAAHFCARMFAALPKVVAKSAAVEPGQAVVIELTGPVSGRDGVRVESVEGKARGIPLFTGDHLGETAPVTTISMSTQVAARIAAGRRDHRELPVHVIGDAEIAARVLDALVITP